MERLSAIRREDPVGEGQIQGKSLVAIARDIADGYVSLNPLVLKKFDPEALKALHHQIQKLQTTARAEKFPSDDIQGIRKRNLRLQRLHTGLFVLENCARDRRVRLF